MMMAAIFFFASFAGAFTTYPHRLRSADREGAGRQPFTLLSSFRAKQPAQSFVKKNRGKTQAIATKQNNHRQTTKNNGPQWTKKDFLSDDPVEKRLLLLLKKIFECRTKRVAKPGPYLLQALRSHKPVRSIWANNAMKCWIEHRDAFVHIQRVEEIFQTLLEMCDEFPDLEPDTYSYGNVAGAWARHATNTHDIRSMERSEQCLRDMWTRWKEVSNTTDLRHEPPGLFLYQMVFQGWMSFSLRNKRLDEAQEGYERALSLLMEMKDLHREGFAELKPDRKFQKQLKTIVHHLRDCAINSLPTLEAITRELEASYGVNGCPQDEIKTFGDIRREMISRHLRNKQVDTESAMSKVLPLLREWWERCHDDLDPFTRPNTIHMNKLITAARQSKVEDAFARSLSLLEEMWILYHETEDESIKPDCITYNSLISSLSNSKKMEENSGGKRAEGLLQDMWDIFGSETTRNKALKPNAVTYGSVMQVWSKSNDKDAGKQAERLLREMWDGYRNGDKDLKPTYIHYNQVISAMSKIGGSDGVNRTEGLLREMWSLYNETGDESIKPTYITYSSLLVAFSLDDNMEKGGERAIGLLEGMWNIYNLDRSKHEGLKPNEIIYSSVIRVCNDENAGDQAEKLLRDMWDRYNNGDKDLKPSRIHYTQAIAAMSNMGDEGVTRAEALFQEMCGLYREKGGDDCFKPDRITYNSMLGVLSENNNKLEDDVEEAEGLLQEMWLEYDAGEIPQSKKNELELCDAT